MGRQLNLLYVTSSPSWGGLEMNVIRLGEEMKRRGHNVLLACSFDGRVYREAQNRFTLFNITSGYIQSFFKLRSILRSFKIDLIHVFRSRDLNKVAFAVLSMMKRPKILFDPQIGIGVRKKDPFHGVVYDMVDSVIAVSKDVADGFERNLPINREKIRIVYPGIDVDRFKFSDIAREKIRRELGLCDDIVIGIVSRISPGKGHEELFKAFKILAEGFDNLKLLVIGGATVGEEGYFKEVRKLADELGISDKVIWAGFRKDVHEILSAIDIFVAPSHAEAFGLSLVEAMSVGLPIIASKNAGFIDIIQDGVNGVFFEKGNYFDLADKIKMLLNEPSLSKSIGENASKTAREKFNIKRYFDEIEAIYFQLLTQKQTGD
ncbi:glycosyltransferase family 4 protein [Candidatus Thermokryptus mobilis]|nr:glycosyltransferase family 4 protein [Candidatus Thermokryptus mobilis]